ncbi:MAG: Ubiquitin carboxyl-terminal hydrolase [candidate division TM6 bacterium GW2011_GWE2_42_60]|nr:MAG: Ubiquitin carboxyl-terminal hydrolase [candidate division TM6 bacterium GW2011_GWE2_42_60]
MKNIRKIFHTLLFIGSLANVFNNVCSENGSLFDNTTFYFNRLGKQFLKCLGPVNNFNSFFIQNAEENDANQQNPLQNQAIKEVKVILEPQPSVQNPKVNVEKAKKKQRFYGFINLGNNCYFNATLSLILQNDEIRKELLLQKHNLKETSFLAKLIECAKEIESGKQLRAYNPESLLKTYYEEILNQKGFDIENITQEDASETVRHCIAEIEKINTMFTFYTQNYKTCSACKKTAFIWQDIKQSMLSLNLKASLEKSLFSYGFTNKSTGKIGLDFIPTNNKNKCRLALAEIYSGPTEEIAEEATCSVSPECNKLKVALNKHYTLTTLPQHLTLSFNRTSYDKNWNQIKKTDAIKIPMEIDMAPFCTKECGTQGTLFSLAGFIVHDEISNDIGHYFSYVKKGEDWWVFNDGKAKVVSTQKIANLTNGAPYTTNETPVIFLYNRVKKS